MVKIAHINSLSNKFYYQNFGAFFSWEYMQNSNFLFLQYVVGSHRLYISERSTTMKALHNIFSTCVKISRFCYIVRFWYERNLPIIKFQKDCQMLDLIISLSSISNKRRYCYYFNGLLKDYHLVSN